MLPSTLPTKFRRPSSPAFFSSACLLAERVALGILRTVVDKTDTRLDNTVYLLRIQRSEECELEQHFSGAFGVCTRIAQHDPDRSRMA